MCVVALCLCVMIMVLCRARPPDLFRYEGRELPTICAYGTVADKYFKNDSFYLVLSKARVKPGVLREIREDEKFNILVKIKCGEDTASTAAFDDMFYAVSAGQECLVSGKLYVFEESRNPGQFDMARYEKCKGIDFEITSARIESVQGRKNLIKEQLLRLKLLKQLLQKLKQLY